VYNAWSAAGSRAPDTIKRSHERARVLRTCDTTAARARLVSKALRTLRCCLRQLLHATGADSRFRLREASVSFLLLIMSAMV